MRNIVPLLFVGLLTGGTYGCSDSGAWAEPASPDNFRVDNERTFSLDNVTGEFQGPFPRASDIERDLRIEVDGPSTIAVGGNPQFRARIVNTSASVTYRVLRPDGNPDSGAPVQYHVDGELTTPGGAVEELPVAKVDRCGNSAYIWTKNVIELDPGEEMRLTYCYYSPTQWVEFMRPGKVILRFYYRYKTWKRIDGEVFVGQANVSGPMKGVPPFVLTAAHRLKVAPGPLTLTLASKGSLKTREPKDLGDVFSARLTNSSQDHVSLYLPTDLDSHVALRVEELSFERPISWPTAVPQFIHLAPGQSISLDTVPDAEIKLQGTIQQNDSGTLEARLVYRNAYEIPQLGRGSVWSNAVTIEVKE